MKYQKYNYDPNCTAEQNFFEALFAIANELHELTIQVSSIGFADKALSDGSIREMGAIENLAFEVQKGLRKVAESAGQNDQI